MGPRQDAKIFTRGINNFDDSAILAAPRDVIQKMILVGTQVRHGPYNQLHWDVNNVTNAFPDRFTAYSTLRQ